MNAPETDDQRALRKAHELLVECSTSHGFLASPSEHDNYRRIWSRDGIILGLAALMSGDRVLIETFGRTLTTLGSKQGPHGEIPSNVGIADDDTSFGGTAGRVDASLWFVIGCAEYFHITDDTQFVSEMLPIIDRVVFLLGAWEFNNKGFIYVPATGDWADEYIHSGYVFYDQLLYLQALRSYRYLQTRHRDRPLEGVEKKIHRLTELLQTNFWICSNNQHPDTVYHETIYEKGRAAADHCAERYWLPFFSPHGYGYRFDSFANILASLLGVASGEQQDTVDYYIEEHVANTAIPLLPAFYPVISTDDDGWDDLKVAFSYNFKNRPHEFHNGGLWPMLTGFHAADLAQRGKREMARTYLAGIAEANRMEMAGTPWGFPEYLNGKHLTPGGNRGQGWSASAYLMAHYGLRGKTVFSINRYDSSLQ